ncbi:MAG: DUF4249 family protein, partial [Bacteroidales bacterium]|nr:DUF4249 family protein [Bacteroidales bacterium]
MNRYRFNKWMVLFGLFFISTSCVEKYWPELNKENEKILVVDGRISNFPGPYTVKLSSSSSVLDTLFIPKSSATVTILDDHGNQEVLTETSPGIYQTKPDGIQGIIGNSYKIKINLLDGTSYESDFEELLNPAAVEDVYYEKEMHYAQNNLETDQEGYQFYVNSEPTGSSKSYFFWEIEETYEYHSSYRIYYMYNGKNNNAFYTDLPIRSMNNV